MRKLSCVVLGLVAACTSPAKEDAKGQIDESLPPSIPLESDGKSDASTNVLPINVQSAHPYANNLTKTYPVALTGLPGCANGARLHFKVLRTEAGYDFLTVQPGGETLDGQHDNYWSQWFNVSGSSTPVSVKLETDASITYHGFEIDSYEWRGTPICPAVAWPACPAGTVDVNKAPGACQCPQQPTCVAVANVQVEHQLWRGFNNTTAAVKGAVASWTHPGPADGPETDTIGTVDTTRLGELVKRAGRLGMLQGSGYTRPITSSGTSERFWIQAGNYSVTWTATQGAQDAAVQSLIDEFEALFTCGNGGGLSCGTGYECNVAEGDCVEEQSCVCIQLYDPVCGVNGHTYGNACTAGCADMPIAHAGECGITGDTCGTLMGLGCLDGYKCRFGTSQFTYPFPDAGGTCVAQNYCDAPADCNELAHPAVPGQWACNANQCAWQAGPTWKLVTGGHFETAHPYANNTSVWKQLYLPAEALALRLEFTRFATEANYDFLEVWTWKNNAWVKVKSYSGTVPAPVTEEFPGRYHYLRFVSDSSVTAQGVTLDAQWR